MTESSSSFTYSKYCGNLKIVQVDNFLICHVFHQHTCFVIKEIWILIHIQYLHVMKLFFFLLKTILWTLVICTTYIYARYKDNQEDKDNFVLWTPCMCTDLFLISEIFVTSLKQCMTFKVNIAIYLCDSDNPPR
jgi:hypothetical protein